MSINDIYNIYSGDMIYRWKHYFQTQNLENTLYVQEKWNNHCNPRYKLMLEHNCQLSLPMIKSSAILEKLVFTNMSLRNNLVYTHADHRYHSLPEASENKTGRNIKILNSPAKFVSPSSDEQSSFPNDDIPCKIVECQQTNMPTFLFKVLPKVNLLIYKC